MKPREPFHAVGQDIREAQARFDEALKEDQDKWVAEVDKDLEMLRLLRKDRDRTREYQAVVAMRDKEAKKKMAQKQRERHEVLKREEQALGRGSFS